VLRLVLAGAVTVQRRSSSDLWSLGVVMYELYTGQRLFGESMSEEAVMALVCSVSAPARCRRLSAHPHLRATPAL